jgi:NADPH:quinone reductase-like Zn-dependent oxidoreductase
MVHEIAPAPRPGEGEVLVRVHAAGVTPTELSWVPTWTTSTGEPRPLPVIPGHEFSGEIAALGAGGMDVGVGDQRVLIHAPPGVSAALRLSSPAGEGRA